MDFDFQKGLVGMLSGWRDDRKAAAEDQREFERQQRIADTNMLKQQEMYRWQKQQEVSAEKEAYGVAQGREEAKYGLSKERQEAERKAEVAQRTEEANSMGLKKGSDKWNAYVYGGKILQDAKTTPKDNSVATRKLLFDIDKEANARAEKAVENISPTMKAKYKGNLDAYRKEIYENEKKTMMASAGLLKETEPPPPEIKPLSQSQINDSVSRLLSLSGKDRREAYKELDTTFTKEDAAQIKQLVNEEGKSDDSLRKKFLELESNPKEQINFLLKLKRTNPELYEELSEGTPAELGMLSLGYTEPLPRVEAPPKRGAFGLGAPTGQRKVKVN